MKVMIILLVVFQNSLVATISKSTTTMQLKETTSASIEHPTTSSTPHMKPTISHTPSSAPHMKPTISHTPSSTPHMKPTISHTPSSTPHMKPTISHTPSSVSDPQPTITKAQQTTTIDISTTISPNSTGTIKHSSSLFPTAQSRTSSSVSASSTYQTSNATAANGTTAMGSSSMTVPTTSPPNLLTRYIKVPGMASLYSTLTYMTISDATTCAAECETADEEDFRCFSFDICAGQKLCSLSPENITDPNLLTDSVGCDHYVRKEPNLKTYKLPDRKVLGKYRRMSGKYNPYSTLTYMSISDVITCATECESADEEDFRCYSFDICAGKKLCSLSSENITDSYMLVDSADCDHYSRWYGSSSVTNKVIHIYPTKEPTTNTGTLVGLGVGMLVVGIIFGIGAIFIYKRCKSDKGDGYELDNLRKY